MSAIESVASTAGTRIVEEGPGVLPELGAIPIRYRVASMLEVRLESGGLGGVRLTETAVTEPYDKDYDVDGGVPSSWTARFDVSRWAVISAYDRAARIGALVIAHDTPTLDMLEGRDDLAAIWDLRVRPDWRGRGVGTLLFQRAEAWMRAHGVRQLMVETQNVNVPACRFYARMGCTLGGLNRFAYPELPGETQLLWYRELT
jgi:GNAT superfamily N-acetyltransferase